MKINDSKQKINVQRQLKLLVNIQKKNLPMTQVLSDMSSELKTVNQQLWTIEDAFRLAEQAARFDYEFVQLARQVYLLNDQRSRIKKVLILYWILTSVKRKKTSTF